MEKLLMCFPLMLNMTKVFSFRLQHIRQVQGFGFLTGKKGRSYFTATTIITVLGRKKSLGKHCRFVFVIVLLGVENLPVTWQT